MTTFQLNQTVSIKGIDHAYGFVVDVYRHNGQEMVKVYRNRFTPPITYHAYELAAYVVQSPDLVLLMSDYGVLYPFEVADVSADGQSVYVYDQDGARYSVPMTEVTRVIPASVARLRSIYVRGE